MKIFFLDLNGFWNQNYYVNISLQTVMEVVQSDDSCFDMNDIAGDFDGDENFVSFLFFRFLQKKLEMDWYDCWQ